VLLVFLNAAPPYDDALSIETSWVVCKIFEYWNLLRVYELVVLCIYIIPNSCLSKCKRLIRVSVVVTKVSAAVCHLQGKWKDIFQLRFQQHDTYLHCK
jgi:hypothetical protein